jgi:Methylmalonyl-CoA mutase, N-terminal domain/subunit
MDPEYTVIGRVARRIWARAMRERYGASARSQMMKYHIQTRPFAARAGDPVQRHPHHAAGDVRVVRQLQQPAHQRVRRSHHHPTEESVRRAVAIQMIINKELGLNFNENPWQGSYVVDG